MELLVLLSSALLGFVVFEILTHPKSKVNRKLPAFRVWRFQIFPRVRFFVKGRVVHFHHWMSFSVITTGSVIATGGISEFILLKGFLIGAIIQGLMLSDAGKIIYENA